jgi:hypothetical protein
VVVRVWGGTRVNVGVPSPGITAGVLVTTLRGVGAVGGGGVVVVNRPVIALQARPSSDKVKIKARNFLRQKCITKTPVEQFVFW